MSGFRAVRLEDGYGSTRLTQTRRHRLVVLWSLR